MEHSEVFADRGNLDNELADLISEIEENTLIRTKIKNTIMNQPQLITLSSANAQQEGLNSTQYNQQAYYQFTCSLLRPALDVESIQLVSSNIPNIQNNIPDTACVFWYYRLSTYSGFTPCINNLFMVRLLPSYYKSEWIGTGYGQNVYFPNYSALATQLAKSCVSDIADTNYQNITYNQSLFPNYTSSYIPFLTNDVSITYNSTLNRFQLTGNATRFAYLSYDKDVVYVKGSVVVDGGIAYISLQDDNNGNTPSSNPTFWSVYSGEIIAGWSDTTTYEYNRIVVYEGIVYISIQASNINHIPTDTAWWEVYDDINFNQYFYLSAGYDDPNVRQAQGGQFVLQWNKYTLYEVGEIVQYNGVNYTANQQTIDEVPFNNTDYWVFTNPLWSSSTSYSGSSLVQYNGVDYTALLSSVNKTPDKYPTYWGVYNTIVYSGLNWTSSQYDFVAYDGNSSSSPVGVYPFPENIPAQPYNPNPSRLLNSILGFQWNGVFNPLLFYNYFTKYLINNQQDTAIEIGDTETSVMNRLRPIPPYAVREPPLLLSGQPYPAGVYLYNVITYTADTFCNLLYSSVVSIYCDLLTTGSLDTQRTNNILAIAPLSNSLAISSFNNYINNPILRVLDHISEIYIELRDEFGEAFWLPNSAVSTFTFKLTYKE